MMKKMKGIAVMESSPYAAAPEDPRIRYKHQSLMQDYQDLEKVKLFHVGIRRNFTFCLVYVILCLCGLDLGFLMFSIDDCPIFPVP